ncbi:Protein Flattop [Amphibalanus amphitrite]|uniref:Protein Flattop n=1 Tax=Amphibalanus amphitrite TaxID=1232801 RepID=A0A6A4VVH4_AMPAM|nr:Protein Flattop [Amphibalanus amphitrite]
MFEQQYDPRRIGNWELPDTPDSLPKPRHGSTRFIANDRGHLLEGYQNILRAPQGGEMAPEGRHDRPKGAVAAHKGDGPADPTSGRPELEELRTLERDRRAASASSEGQHASQPAITAGQFARALRRENFSHWPIVEPLSDAALLAEPPPGKQAERTVALRPLLHPGPTNCTKNVVVRPRTAPTPDTKAPTPDTKPPLLTRRPTTALARKTTTTTGTQTGTGCKRFARACAACQLVRRPERPLETVSSEFRPALRAGRANWRPEVRPNVPQSRRRPRLAVHRPEPPPPHRVTTLTPPFAMWADRRRDEYPARHRLQTTYGLMTRTALQPRRARSFQSLVYQ